MFICSIRSLEKRAAKKQGVFICDARTDKLLFGMIQTVSFPRLPITSL
jgi:hypothetical protein